ncbi:hypothetical protein [Hymenobacter frigidus]
MSRYRFVAAVRGHYPVRRLCQVLGVPASRFYAWQTEPATGCGVENADLGNSLG